MDKKLLADFSRIIRDIESKNLYKEADILNNCLVRLAQVSDDIATDSNTQTDLDALVDTTVQNSQPNTTNQQPAPSQTPAETASYSPELLIKINDLANITDNIVAKTSDFVAQNKIDSVSMEQINKAIETANQITRMNELKDSDKVEIEDSITVLESLKNSFNNI